MKSQKRILSDHKLVGKKLVPPFATLENKVEVSWVDIIIPDLIWIALIRTKLGNKIGTEVVNKFISISTQHEDSSFKMFAFISTYESLSDDTKARIKEDLIKEGVKSIMLDCLEPFLNMYPSCPLAFLQEASDIKAVDSKFLQSYKELLLRMMDKRSVISTFTIANIIYSLFLSNRIEVDQNSILTKLPKIQDYPNTELSRVIASNLRACINALYSKEHFDGHSSNWANSFWNTGIKLEPCKI